MADKPEQDEKGRFLPGNSGFGGRPKGSRNKLGEQFLSNLQADWEENGEDVIIKAREEKPMEYVKMVASLLPKELLVRTAPTDEMTDEELTDRLGVIEAFIAGRSEGDASPTHTGTGTA